MIEGPDGTIAHAEMHLGPGTIMPKSPMAESEFAMKSPRALGGINQCLYVAVEDPDAHYERTKAAGAEIIMEPFDTDYGARNYCARDLEGHLWSFGTYWPRTAACETGSKQPRYSIGRQASELAWAKGTLTPHRRVGGSARLPS